MDRPRSLATAPPLVLGGVALLAAGCTATPSATELVAAQRATGGRVSEAEAAGAFLEYIGVVNAALRSDDVGALARMTASQCRCADLVALLDQRFDDGAEFVGAAFDAGDVTVLHRHGDQADVRARVSVSAYEVHSADGLVIDSRPADEYVATYTVRSNGDSWRVVDVRPQQGSSDGG